MKVNVKTIVEDKFSTISNMLDDLQPRLQEEIDFRKEDWEKG